MNQVAEIMTRGVRAVAPNESLQAAAKAMDELNVGALPVLDHGQVVGMVTDRDITVRGVADGKSVDTTPVSEVMSAHVECCYEDEPIDEVMEKMRHLQVRRVPVMDRQNQLVGMISLGDLATKSGNPDEVTDTLEDISSPSEPDRPLH